MPPILEAEELNDHLLSAREAALAHEQAMADAVQAVLDEAVDDAVHQYELHAEALVAAGPHADEVFKTGKAQAKLATALAGSKAKAADSFAGALPTCIPDGSAALTLPVGLDREWLRKTLADIDAGKAAGKNPRGLMDKIREHAGMSPTKARKALAAEDALIRSGKLSVMSEQVPGGFLYDKPFLDADGYESLIQQTFDWPETNADVAGAAIQEAEAGTGQLVTLVRTDGKLSAVANIETGSDSIIIHDIASSGIKAMGDEGPGTILLRKIARDAGDRGFGLKLRSTRDAEGYYQKLGFVKEGRTLNYSMSPDAARAFGSGRSMLEPGPLGIPKADLTNPTVRNAEWNKSATFLAGKKNADPRNLKPSHWKEKTARRLAQRLKGNPDWQYMLDNYRFRSQRHYTKEHLAVDGEELTGQLVQQWAQTSSDEHPMAQALQRAVKDEFGLSEAAMKQAMHGLGPEEVDKIYNAGRIPTGYGGGVDGQNFGPALRQFVRAMWEQTQEDLAAAGYAPGDTIVLYRGMAVPEKEIPAKTLYADTISTGKTEIGLQPASSYSSSLQTAASFAVDYGENGAPIMFASEVPIERILGSARSGFGCIGETEFVVLGERAGVIDEAVFASAPGETPASQEMWSNAHDFWEWVKAGPKFPVEEVSIGQRMADVGFPASLDVLKGELPYLDEIGLVGKPGDLIKAGESIGKPEPGQSYYDPVPDKVKVWGKPGDTVELYDHEQGLALEGKLGEDGVVYVTKNEALANSITPGSTLLTDAKGGQINWQIGMPGKEMKELKNLKLPSAAKPGESVTLFGDVTGKEYTGWMADDGAVYLPKVPGEHLLDAEGSDFYDYKIGTVNMQGEGKPIGLGKTPGGKVKVIDGKAKIVDGNYFVPGEGTSDVLITTNFDAEVPAYHEPDGKTYVFREDLRHNGVKAGSNLFNADEEKVKYVLAQELLTKDGGHTIIAWQEGGKWVANKADIDALPAGSKLYDLDLKLTSVTPAKPKVLKAAGDKRCDGIEIKWDVKSPYFGKAYAVSAEKVTQITDTTRLRIMQTLRDSYDNGLSIRDTAKNLETLKGINASRAKLIARTEMTALVNGATQAAAQVIAQVTGDVYRKQWLTAPGAEWPRHELYPGLDRQEVAMDELFDVGGTALEFPGDPAGPPDEVCNCRCSMLLIEPSGSTLEGPPT